MQLDMLATAKDFNPVSGKRVGNLQRQQHMLATVKAFKPVATGLTLERARELLPGVEKWEAPGGTVHLTLKDAAVWIWRNNLKVSRNDSRGVVAARGIVTDKLQLPKPQVSLTSL